MSPPFLNVLSLGSSGFEFIFCLRCWHKNFVLDLLLHWPFTLLSIHFGNSHLTYSEWQWLNSDLLPDTKILRNASQSFSGFKNLNGIRCQFHTASCATDLAALCMIQTQPFSTPRLETRRIQTVSSAVISLWRVTVFSSLNTALLLGSQNRGDAGCFSLGKVGTRQVPEGPSIPTTDLAIDLFDPKSSMSFMDFSLQSLAYPCCNYWLHRTYVGMYWSLTILFWV